MTTYQKQKFVKRYAEIVIVILAFIGIAYTIISANNSVSERLDKINITYRNQNKKLTEELKTAKITIANNQATLKTQSQQINSLNQSVKKLSK